MLFDQLAHTINIYNQIASIYATRWFQSSSIEPLMRDFSSLIKKEGAIVLDAGCGCGREVNFLTKLGFDVVGVDLSSGLIKEARQRLPESYFRVMDIRYLSYPDNLFDAIVCAAVINHFVEEDIEAALDSFRRVIKLGGLLCVTFKEGDSSSYDNLRRFNVYYKSDKIRELFSQYGFDIEFEKKSKGEDDIIWTQMIARMNSKLSPINHRQCFFCQDNLFPNNRSSKRPIAGSILFGDSDHFVAVDCSPLVKGHLLMITNEHSSSYMRSDINQSKINDFKHRIRLMTHDVLGRIPLFLEHGTVEDEARESSCIDHAHIHSLPLQHNIKTVIENSLGGMQRFKSNKNFRSYLSKMEYIYYEDKASHAFIRYDLSKEIQSQFFRIVVGEYLNIENVKWAALLHDDAARQNFKDTITDFTAYLDAQIIQKPIFSRILENRSYRIIGYNSKQPLRNIKLYNRETFLIRESPKVKRVRSLFGGDTTLADLGEDRITRDIIYSVFHDRDRAAQFVGDDVARLELDLGQYDSLVTTVDPCPRPIAFDLIGIDYRVYGWLAVIISISDLAASGADPLGMLISCEMPSDMQVSDFIDFLEGVLLASEKYQCPVVGGNIKDADRFACSTSMLGKGNTEKLLSRSGSDPGDSVFIVGNSGHLWAAILARKFNLVLSAEDQMILDRALLFPEPNLLASLSLAKTGVLSACMDASDGPTGCLSEIAKKNNINIIVSKESLRPDTVVENVARQIGIDPRYLMLTWGNWEIVFTANRESLLEKISGHPIADIVQFIGYAVSGEGKVCFDKVSEKTIIPDLSSKRFTRRSSFTHGLDAYMNYLIEVGKR